MKNVDIKDVAELKKYLRGLKARRSTRYGSFGEKIFGHQISICGRRVKKLHKHGADFLIDNDKRVDVKTALMLEQKFGVTFKTISKSKQASNTAYAYVLLLEDSVAVYLAENKGEPLLLKNISWPHAFSIFNSEMKIKNEKKLVTNEVEMANDVVKELTNWLVENHHKKAKFVTRHNKATQDSMCKSGWGPEAFYHDPIRNCGNIDLVILLFFDGGNVYDLFAYPLSESRKIKWLDKKVGLNLNKRKTFNCADLPARYKFQDVGDFKRQMGKRFFDA